MNYREAQWIRIQPLSSCEMAPMACYPAPTKGDDRTDEDTFRAMPLAAYTVKVGSAPRCSLTRYHMLSAANVRDLLRRLL